MLSDEGVSEFLTGWESQALSSVVESHSPLTSQTTHTSPSEPSQRGKCPPAPISQAMCHPNNARQKGLHVRSSAENHGFGISNEAARISPKEQFLFSSTSLRGAHWCKEILPSGDQSIPVPQAAPEIPSLPMP